MTDEMRLGISKLRCDDLQNEVEHTLNRLEKENDYKSLQSMTREQILEKVYDNTTADTLREHFVLGVIAAQIMTRRERAMSFEINKGMKAD